jgi:thiosulfate reductase cytochrome b subunit
MHHNLSVRASHWINFLSFLALAVSGFAILLAHPRFYWGESGYFDTPAAFTLPLPVNLDQSGWGRDLHFLSAWIVVINGIIYAALGLLLRHFRFAGYSPLQRLVYLVVVFVLLPGIILSGLTLSPAVTAAYPGLFTMFGGRQSARTVHFLLAGILVAFFLAHVALAIRTRALRSMMMGTR